MTTRARRIDLGAGQALEVQRLEPDGGEPRIRIDLTRLGQRTGNRIVLRTAHAEQLARFVLTLTTDPESAR